MKKTNVFRIFLGGLMLSVIGGFGIIAEAQACPGHEGKGDKKRMGAEHFIQRFDANKDGVLQLSELPEKLRSKLVEADTNRDGKLSAEELKAHRESFKGKKGKGFANLDKNGDGVLTKEEVGEHKWARISQADANKDGKVTKAELEQAHSAKRGGKKAHRTPKS